VGLLFSSPLIKYKGSKTNFYDFKPRAGGAFVFESLLSQGFLLYTVAISLKY
jgi:hypothetical protein